MSDHKWLTDEEVKLLKNRQSPAWDDVNRLLADREKALPLIVVAYLLLKDHFPDAEIVAELLKVLDGVAGE